MLTLVDLGYSAASSNPEYSTAGANPAPFNAVRTVTTSAAVSPAQMVTPRPAATPFVVTPGTVVAPIVDTVMPTRVRRIKLEIARLPVLNVLL